MGNNKNLESSVKRPDLNVWSPGRGVNKCLRCTIQRVVAWQQQQRVCVCVYVFEVVMVACRSDATVVVLVVRCASLTSLLLPLPLPPSLSPCLPRSLPSPLLSLSLYTSLPPSLPACFTFSASPCLSLPPLPLASSTAALVSSGVA